MRKLESFFHNVALVKTTLRRAKTVALISQTRNTSANFLCKKLGLLVGHKENNSKNSEVKRESVT